MLAVPVFSDEFANVLTRRPMAPSGDLLIDEGLERFRKGDVHRAHDLMLAAMAKIGKLFSAPTPRS